MSKWILVGPVVGVGLVALALVIGYVVVPPIVVQKVTEVSRMRLVDAGDLVGGALYVYFKSVNFLFNLRNESSRGRLHKAPITTVADEFESPMTHVISCRDDL